MRILQIAHDCMVLYWTTFSPTLHSLMGFIGTRLDTVNCTDHVHKYDVIAGLAVGFVEGENKVSKNNTLI